MVENIPISKLKLLENNPRSIKKDQMDKLCKSIQNDPEFLQCRPVLVNCLEGINYVYAGNQRVRAAKKLGMKEIPCIVDYELDEETVKRRIIQDNKTYGEFDWDILANEWNIDTLLDCGFTADELVGSVQDIDIHDNNEEQDQKEEQKICETCGKKLKKGK